MYTWFVTLLLRIAGGERLEPATRRDYRIWFAVLFLLPLSVWLWVTFEPELPATAGFLRVWLQGLVFIALFGLAWLLCIRFVPAFVSLVLSIVVWSVGFWMAWHGKLGF
jgi:hypothetical protein